MSLYIITEPEYEETLWATRLYTLINELKLKRIPIYEKGNQAL